ncbi:MAG: arginase family protein [Clostridiales bacterium]
MTARTRFISCNTGFKEAHGVLLGAWLNDNNHGVNAPDIIREVSAKIDDYHLNTGRSLSALGLYDGGNITNTIPNKTEKLNAVYEKARSVMAEKKFLLTVAEDREISYSLFKAAHEEYKDLKVLVIDAHHGLENKTEGEINHENYLTHALNDFLHPENILELGVRCGSKESYENGAKRHRHLPPRVKRGLIERLPKLYHHPCYVSVDLDVLEPSYAPGVKNSASWGISSVELMETIRYLESVFVVGMDIVGLDLSKDVGNITATLGANLIKESFVYLIDNYEKTS